MSTKTKYINVTGGVLSGLGKGILCSSIGLILKDYGESICMIKCDPYLNIDSGTMSPYEHAEVFVLSDGTEVDLDLGNYERFVGVKLNYFNQITSGKIFKSVIEKERKGEYLGKTVQIIPHVTNEIIDWIVRVSRDFSICIIELGGTIGDIESMHFIEALRQLQFKVNKDRFMSIHVTLIPEMFSEQKTKPAQNSVKKLRSLGISPDVIVTRSEREISKKVRRKLSMFCFSSKEDGNNIIDCHNIPNIFNVPLMLLKQHIDGIILNNLGIKKKVKKPQNQLVEWKRMLGKCEKIRDKKKGFLKIGLVGKYTESLDCYFSVVEAIKHACIELEVKVDLVVIESSNLVQPSGDSKDLKENHEGAWKKLKSVHGLICPGGFGVRGIEGKIIATRYVRENKVPFLGICLGFQVAAIEFARNVLKLEDANSTEFDPKTKNAIVYHMKEIDPNLKGGNMRLGEFVTRFHVPQGFDSIAFKLYGKRDLILERHRHRFEINSSEFLKKFEEKGMMFVGRDKTGKRMEILELKNHPFFIGSQYHCEFLSRPAKPHPLFFGLCAEGLKNVKDSLTN